MIRVRYSGIQPQYFPRLHYFARILNADTFVIRDDCQYVNSHKFPNGTRGKSFQSHSPIKQSQGINLLTIPVLHDGYESIYDTKIHYSETPWAINHIKSIQTNYGKAKNFPQVQDEISKILEVKYESLADLNITTICWGILKILGETAEFKNLNISYVTEKLKLSKKFRLKDIRRGFSISALKEKELSANEKIIAICKEVGANEDYSGRTAVSAYVDHSLFEKNGIKITIQDWVCKPYVQLFAKQQEFIPNLSIIDLLMNVSLEEVQATIIG